jgi:predicted type IV restriction endonuclease
LRRNGVDFIDELRTLAARIPKQIEHLQTEEATKHALVMPFIRALGYDDFDPTEVNPEYIADVGIKKGRYTRKLWTGSMKKAAYPSG